MVPLPEVTIFNPAPSVLVVKSMRFSALMSPMLRVSMTRLLSCASTNAPSLNSPAVETFRPACRLMSESALCASISDSKTTLGLGSKNNISPATLAPLLPCRLVGESSSSSPSPEPPVITSSSGSSSSVPRLPAAARRSALPRKAREALPETSAKPPSPPAGPPRAAMRPRKSVRSSDQTMMRPPSPVPVASARILASASTLVCRALAMAGLAP